jgi:hypothetical protein
MIFQVVKLITEELKDYISLVRKDSEEVKTPFILMENISMLDEEQLKTTNKVIVTLINISEEATLKNDPGRRIKNNVTSEYSNAPVNLNLYLLFSACIKNYELALIFLSRIITFFQGKNIFKGQINDIGNEDLQSDFHIILDLYSLTMEQVNYLWSTLGGKQHPFVLYKIRLVQLERDSTRETRGVIKQVRIDGKDNT